MRRTRRRLDLWHDLAEASQPRFPPPLCKSRRSWVVSNYFSFVSTRSRCWVLLQNPPVSIDSPFSFSYFLFLSLHPTCAFFSYFVLAASAWRGEPEITALHYYAFCGVALCWQRAHPYLDPRGPSTHLTSLLLRFLCCLFFFHSSYWACVWAGQLVGIRLINLSLNMPMHSLWQMQLLLMSLALLQSSPRLFFSTVLKLTWNWNFLSVLFEFFCICWSFRTIFVLKLSHHKDLLYLLLTVPFNFFSIVYFGVSLFVIFNFTYRILLNLTHCFFFISTHSIFLVLLLLNAFF